MKKEFKIPGTQFPDVKVSKDGKELDPSTYSFDQDGQVVLNNLDITKLSNFGYKIGNNE